jgi:porin
MGNRLQTALIDGTAERRLKGIFTAFFLVAGLCTVPVTGLAQDTDQNARVIPLPSPQKGISFGLNWDADAYDNLDGGTRTGYATDSVLSAGFGLDTGELGWWQGGQFSFGVQAIASTHPSEYVGDLQTLSNLDSPNRRQVSEFWYSQQIGPAVVRGGIMDVNSFFNVNDTASLFTNASFGITPSITANVPTATYPDSSWGLMTRLGSATDNWLIGVFQGNPTYRSTALHDGAMLVAERGWRSPANGTHVGIGAWYRQVLEAGGLPTHDWGAYANFEQALPGHPDAVTFVQVGASPGQVNTVPVYLGAGIHFYNASRFVSEWGVGVARAWIRDHAAETSLEGTALIPIADSRFALQPDVQYIFHPSGIHPNALAVALRLHLTLY